MKFIITTNIVFTLRLSLPSLFTSSPGRHQQTKVYLYSVLIISKGILDFWGKSFICGSFRCLSSEMKLLLMFGALSFTTVSRESKRHQQKPACPWFKRSFNEFRKLNNRAIEEILTFKGCIHFSIICFKMLPQTSCKCNKEAQNQKGRKSLVSTCHHCWLTHLQVVRKSSQSFKLLFFNTCFDSSADIGHVSRSIAEF